MPHSSAPSHNNKSRKSGYQNLQAKQIEMIDEAIGILGDFGEVRLIVEKGRLRFLITQRSYDMLKLQPGSLVEHFR